MILVVDLQLVLSGSLLLLALVGVIVASAAYSTPWGLFVLFPYVLLPMTATIFSSLAGRDDLGCGPTKQKLWHCFSLALSMCFSLYPSISVWTNFGCFFEAVLWIVALAIPSILCRVDAINGSQLGWLLASDVFVFASFMSLALISGE